MKNHLFVKAFLVCGLTASLVQASVSIARPGGTDRDIVPELISNEVVKASEPYFDEALTSTISPIPPGGGANSSTIRVKTIGTVDVFLYIRTAALFNTGGRSRYTVSLRRGLPSSGGASGTEVASETITVNSTRARVRLSAAVGTCNEIGGYHVRVTNVSTDNPQMGIVSDSGDILGKDGRFFGKVSSPETKGLSMSGFSLLDFDRGDEKTVSIGSIAKSGTIKLKGKWHVPGLVPTFKPLKIYLKRPDGTNARSGTFYSIHSSTGTKLDTYYIVTKEDAAQSGPWKLRIVNASDSRIEGFNIKKGSDPNPFVPSFESHFTTACGS